MGGMDALYVIEFPNGRVKVGRSATVANRLRQHAATLDAMGEPVRQVWSAPVGDGPGAEAQLIRTVRAAGGRPTGAREVFDGVSFAFVTLLALDVASHYVPPPERATVPRQDSLARIVLDDLLGWAAEREPDRLPSSAAVRYLLTLDRPEYVGLDQARLAEILRPYGVRTRRARSAVLDGRSAACYRPDELESARSKVAESERPGDVQGPPGPTATVSDNPTSQACEMPGHDRDTPGHVGPSGTGVPA